MGLYYFHRVLISSAILFCVGLTWFFIRLYQASGQMTSLLMAVGTVVIGLVLIGYLFFLFKRAWPCIHQPGQAVNIHTPGAGG